jgi:hypothetical protein
MDRPRLIGASQALRVAAQGLIPIRSSRLTRRASLRRLGQLTQALRNHRADRVGRDV